MSVEVDGTCHYFDSTTKFYLSGHFHSNYIAFHPNAHTFLSGPAFSALASTRPAPTSFS